MTRIRVYSDFDGTISAQDSLVWLLDARKGGKHEAELNYLTEGVNWRSDYVAVVGNDDKLDLTGWVTLNNRSGMDYRNARLKLVAGDAMAPSTPFQLLYEKEDEKAGVKSLDLECTLFEASLVHIALFLDPDQCAGRQGKRDVFFRHLNIIRAILNSRTYN